MVSYSFFLSSYHCIILPIIVSYSFFLYHSSLKKLSTLRGHALWFSGTRPCSNGIVRHTSHWMIVEYKYLTSPKYPMSQSFYSKCHQNTYLLYSRAELIHSPLGAHTVPGIWTEQIQTETSRLRPDGWEHPYWLEWTLGLPRESELHPGLRSQKLDHSCWSTESTAAGFPVDPSPQKYSPDSPRNGMAKLKDPIVQPAHKPRKTAVNRCGFA